MPLDLLGDIEQHVDLAFLRATLDYTLHDTPHPPRAFAARRALAAAFVLIKIRQTRDGADDVGRLVHHNCRSCAEAGLELGERVEVHWAIDNLSGGNEPHRRPTGNDSEQIVPAAPHAATMLFNQLAERDRHRLFDVARLIDVTRDAEDLGAEIVGCPETREP